MPKPPRTTVDAFTEAGNHARVATWQLDVRKSADGQWSIAALYGLLCIAALQVSTVALLVSSALIFWQLTRSPVGQARATMLAGQH